MTWAPAAALVVILTLAGVLGTSGFAKLRDTRATRDAFQALRIPSVIPADAAARALPWVELALAALLLVSPTGWLIPVAAAVLLLMLAYTCIVARALTFDEPVTCSCFGSLGRHQIDRTTLARNALLSLLGAGATWFALDGGSTASAMSDLDGGEWATLGATVTAVVVTIFVVGASPGARRQTTSAEDLVDYERALIPYGVLSRSNGPSATLTELAATQARMLIVLNPGCGPCVRIGHRLDDWAKRLAPAVGILAVYPSEVDAGNVETHDSGLSTWEPDLNVRRVLGSGTPSAVILGADGYLAGGPATGEDEVVELVEAVQAELEAAESPQTSLS